MSKKRIFKTVNTMPAKRNLLVLFFVLSIGTCSVWAQEPITIKVKKESNLSKAVFDNVDLRLMVIDRFGNPRENKIASYQLYVKGKRETVSFEGYGNQLTGEMLNYLKKQKAAVKLFFTGVNAVDDEGHPVKLPDVIDNWFPECSNCKR